MPNQQQPVRKKVIRKQSANALRHKKARKSRTKAEIRRDFLARTERIVGALRVLNRVPMVEEKIRHVEVAVAELEVCVSLRSGNHLLRHQLSLCRDLLYELKQSGERSSRAEIDILFVPDLFRCCGAATKRKAR